MIIIVGFYPAAKQLAASRCWARNQWVPAFDVASAIRALAGRNPDTTTIEYVRGFEKVLTPSVQARINALTALRRDG